MAEKSGPVLVAQWTARQTSDLKVAGSSPAGDYIFFVNARLWFAPDLASSTSGRGRVRRCVRVVKEVVLNTTGLCPRGFKSRRRRSFVASIDRSQRPGSCRACFACYLIV